MSNAGGPGSGPQPTLPKTPQKFTFLSKKIIFQTLDKSHHLGSKAGAGDINKEFKSSRNTKKLPPVLVQTTLITCYDGNVSKHSNLTIECKIVY